MMAAVITCAGNGSRFGKNKLLEPLQGKPVFVRTIQQFVRSKVVDEIIVTIREENSVIFRDIVKTEQLPVNLVIGREKRYMSAYEGVKATKAEKVLIHDGARPLVPVSLIREVAKQLKEKSAVMAAFPAETCVKLVQNLRVIKHIEREESYLGQTPHGFDRQLIIQAYKQAIKNNLDGMDDAELVASFGQEVHIVMGHKNNIKITTPIDLLLASKIWESDVEEYA